MRYTDHNTYADHPGRVKLSKRKLRQVKKLVCTSFGETLFFHLRIPAVKEYVAYGDTQPACVMSVSPLVISAYSDEMDAVVMLRFPDALAQQYKLSSGDRLVTVNTYRWLEGYEIAPDIFVGEHFLQRYSDFQPIVPLFICKNETPVQEKCRLFDEETWETVTQKSRQYAAEHPDLIRDGFYYWKPQQA